jgi:hypothetical protein
VFTVIREEPFHWAPRCVAFRAARRVVGLTLKASNLAPEAKPKKHGRPKVSLNLIVLIVYAILPGRVQGGLLQTT